MSGQKLGGEVTAFQPVRSSELDLLALILGVSNDPESLDLLYARLCREKSLQWLRTDEGEADTYALPAPWNLRLRACFELVDRVIGESLRTSDVIHNPRDVRQFLLHRLGHYKTEQFAVLYLDSANRMLEFQVLFSGTVNSVRVYPRVVIQQALAVNASALIISHNHPSGSWELSAQDIDLTLDLRDLVEKLDIRILDHMVVAQGVVISMVEQGLL
jgi:DNA repair protein RadC